MVAAEASGDLLGAHLIAALKARRAGLRFSGIGGPKMLAQGFESLVPMDRLGVRGYAEVLRHYREIMGIRHKEYTLEGWQFHPESFLTECGPELLRRFLALGG